MLVMSPSRSEDDLRAFEVLYPLAPDLPSSGSLHRDLNYTHCHYQTVKARYGYFLSLPHCVRIGEFARLLPSLDVVAVSLTR